MVTRSNMNFQQMKLGTSVIPHFHVILTKQSISEIILFIRGNLQGQRLFSKTSKKKKNSNNKARNVCNTSISWDFD